MKEIIKLSRRDVIRKGITVASVAGIVSLLPHEARATGSWSSNSKPLSTPYETDAAEQYRKARQKKTVNPDDRYVVPFSNAWRSKRNWQ